MARFKWFEILPTLTLSKPTGCRAQPMGSTHIPGSTPTCKISLTFSILFLKLGNQITLLNYNIYYI